MLLAVEEVGTMVKAAEILSNLGISGVILVIWYLSSRDKTNAERIAKDSLALAEREADHSDRIIKVVEDNTKAITELTTMVKTK